MAFETVITSYDNFELAKLVAILASISLITALCEQLNLPVKEIPVAIKPTNESAERLKTNAVSETPVALTLEDYVQLAEETYSADYVKSLPFGQRSLLFKHKGSKRFLQTGLSQDYFRRNTILVKVGDDADPETSTMITEVATRLATTILHYRSVAKSELTETMKDQQAELVAQIEGVIREERVDTLERLRVAQSTVQIVAIPVSKEIQEVIGEVILELAVETTAPESQLEQELELDPLALAKRGWQRKIAITQPSCPYPRGEIIDYTRVQWLGESV